MDKTAPWRPDRLLKALLIWTALTTLIFWLPAVRGAFDGSDYEWSVFGFEGRGTTGAYWFPLLGTALSIATFWMGWRGARFPFHALMGGWHLFLAIGITTAVVQDAEGFHLQGDTMGMDIDLAVIGPVFFGAWALLAFWWIARDLRNDRATEIPRWSARNTRWLALLVALFPVQFALLHYGSVESAMDQVGVFVTVAQWMLSGAAFAPRQ